MVVEVWRQVTLYCGFGKARCSGFVLRAKRVSIFERSSSVDFPTCLQVCVISALCVCCSHFLIGLCTSDGVSVLLCCFCVLFFSHDSQCHWLWSIHLMEKFSVGEVFDRNVFVSQWDCTGLTCYTADQITNRSRVHIEWSPMIQYRRNLCAHVMCSTQFGRHSTLLHMAPMMFAIRISEMSFALPPDDVFSVRWRVESIVGVRQSKWTFGQHPMLDSNSFMRQLGKLCAFVFVFMSFPYLQQVLVAFVGRLLWKFSLVWQVGFCAENNTIYSKERGLTRLNCPCGIRPTTIPSRILLVIDVCHQASCSSTHVAVVVPIAPMKYSAVQRHTSLRSLFFVSHLVSTNRFLSFFHCFFLGPSIIESIGGVRDVGDTTTEIEVNRVQIIESSCKTEHILVRLFYVWNVVHFGECFSQCYVVCIRFVSRVVIWFSGLDFCCAVEVAAWRFGSAVRSDPCMARVRKAMEFWQPAAMSNVCPFLFVFSSFCLYSKFAFTMTFPLQLACHGIGLLLLHGHADAIVCHILVLTINVRCREMAVKKTESWRCMTKRCVVTRSTTTSVLPCLRFLAFFACLFDGRVHLCLCGVSEGWITLCSCSMTP